MGGTERHERTEIDLVRGKDPWGFDVMGERAVAFLHHREFHGKGPNYTFSLVEQNPGNKPKLHEEWYFRPQRIDILSLGILQAKNRRYLAVFYPIKRENRFYVPYRLIEHSAIISPFSDSDPSQIPTEPKVNPEEYLKIKTTHRYVPSDDPFHSETLEHTLRMEIAGSDEVLAELFDCLRHRPQR